MNDRAFVQQEILDASVVDPSDIRCPRCRGNTLVLTGLAQMPQQGIMEGGVIVERLSNPEAGGTFDIERIDCVSCTITYLIRAPKLFQLERENLKLTHKVEDLQGALDDCSGTADAGVRKRHV